MSAPEEAAFTIVRTKRDYVDGVALSAVNSRWMLAYLPKRGVAADALARLRQLLRTHIGGPVRLKEVSP